VTSVCRFGHRLHAATTRLVRHSKTGKTWTRCLICHAARQREVRAVAQNRALTFGHRAKTGEHSGSVDVARFR
jgi:hypothetical protein